MKPVAKVLWLLENSKTMVVATADLNGKPWISPVFFSYDDEHNLYWISDKNARHSKNINSRPEVGIVIIGKIPSEAYPDAVYVDGLAAELAIDSEINKGIAAMSRRAQDEKFIIHSSADITGSASWRLYKVTPREITKREDAYDESTGQAITIRVPIDLKR